MHQHHSHTECHQHPESTPRPVHEEPSGVHAGTRHLHGEECGCREGAQVEHEHGCGCHEEAHHEHSHYCGCHEEPLRAERCTCGCHGRPGGFRRRLLTREEKIERLLRYLEALYTEAEAVEEHLADLGVDLDELEDWDEDEETEDEDSAGDASGESEPA